MISLQASSSSVIPQIRVGAHSILVQSAETVRWRGGVLHPARERRAMPDRCSACGGGGRKKKARGIAMDFAHEVDLDRKMAVGGGVQDPGFELIQLNQRLYQCQIQLKLRVGCWQGQMQVSCFHFLSAFNFVDF